MQVAGTEVSFDNACARFLRQRFEKKWRWKTILRTVRERRKTEEEHQVSWIFFLAVRKKIIPGALGANIYCIKSALWTPTASSSAC